MCEPSEWEPLPPRRGEAATGDDGLAACGRRHPGSCAWIGTVAGPLDRICLQPETTPSPVPAVERILAARLAEAEAAGAARGYREAANEIHVEARWQSELAHRNGDERDHAVYALARLAVVEQICENRAAALASSSATEPESAS